MGSRRPPASRLAAALTVDLPPDVRQAALVEGSMVGGARESLATLIHASSDETRDVKSGRDGAAARPVRPSGAGVPG